MRTGLVLAVVVALAPGVCAQFDQFTWTLKGSPAGSGFVTPDLMHVTGPDNCSTGDSDTTWFETVLSYPATVSVLVDFTTLDAPCDLFDAPAWVLDETVSQFGDPYPGTWCPGTYAVEFEVMPGEPFGFGIWTLDCIMGAGLGDFHDLVVTPHEWLAIGAAIDPQSGGVVEGSAADGVGDLDGDGHADFITGDPASDTVRVLSWKGAILFETIGSGKLGTCVAGAGDLDGDGLNDILAGAPNENPQHAGAVHAWRSSDGEELFAVHGSGLWKMGTDVAGPGDLDGDGLADVAVRWTKIGEQIRLLGGPDGHLLGTLGSTSTAGMFGAGLDGVGDVDLDGIPDLLVGIPHVSTVGIGAARLYSGATHAVLLEFAGSDKTFGTGVSGAGDVDHDGTPDLLVGESANLSLLHYGAITVFSGASGVELFKAEGAPDKPILGQLDGGSDVTGDGEPDFLTTTLFTPHVLQVRSGPQGDVVVEVGGTDSSPTSADVAILGDIDGVGSEDVALIVDAVHVFKSLDGPGAPSLAGFGNVAGDQPVEFAVADGPPGAMALLVLGGTGVQLPLLGGELQPTPDLILLLILQADGSSSVQGRWPPGLPQFTTIWAQAWFLDSDGPQGWTSTNGVIGTQTGN